MCLCLLNYTAEVSAIELRLTSGVDEQKMARQVQKILGPDFDVKDRYRQNESTYAMMASEKAMIYAILMFIILIISCNILGSLAMLIIEKKSDVETLQSLGADDRLISRIFLLEGWLISLLGVVAGIIGGLIVCFLQQQFGLLGMSGNFLVNAYPVRVLWTDVLSVALSVAAIGFLAALIPAHYVKRFK